jgi:hypothetical protein
MPSTKLMQQERACSPLAVYPAVTPWEYVAFSDYPARIETYLTYLERKEPLVLSTCIFHPC